MIIRRTEAIVTANYVYHKVICTKECLDRFFIDTDLYGDGEVLDPPCISFNKLFPVKSLTESREQYGSEVYYGYGEAWYERPDDLWEIKFATRWKYPIFAIIRAVELSHDLIWFAVEENHVYISKFYWSDGVKEDVLDIEDEYNQWSQKNPDFVFSLADYDDTAWYFLPTAMGTWRNWESSDGFARYSKNNAVHFITIFKEAFMEKYWYCGVAVKGSRTVYSYISDIGEIPVGAYVEVPFGSENTLRIGLVESCAEYASDTAPYPVEKTKHIARLATAEEYESQEPLPSYHPHWDDLDFADDIDVSIEEEEWDEVLDWAIEHHESTDPETIRKVIECYTMCLEQNMPVAALNLGTFYYLGRGVEQDYKKAYELYKIAADAGELRAICNCGYCFYYGRHQAVDYAKAFWFFSLGALLHDNANCLYKLGDMYLNGYSVEKNETYAYRLYSRALERCAEEDCDGWGETVMPDVQSRVGKCFLYGIGTAKSTEKAHELLCLALVGFYKRRKTDPFVAELIQNTKIMIVEAQEKLDDETLT